MTVEMSRALARLTQDKRDRVLERAAILHAEGGLTWPEADERALILEGVVEPKLPGVDP